MSFSLKEYLRDAGITQAAFAKENGWTQPCVSGWCNGKTPTLKVALRIERLTGGKVKPSSFAPDEQAAA